MGRTRRSILLVVIVFTAAATLVASPSASAAERPNRFFLSVCQPSHSSNDDPIVFPGKPGATHRHDFFGNKTTDSDSNYVSLLTAGGTTCDIPEDTAAYWFPSLYDDGKLIEPKASTVYYLRGIKSEKTIQAFPPGLMMVAKGANSKVKWACKGSEERGERLDNIPTCAKTSYLVLRVVFPSCWDGHSLDSVDHTSHMSFPKRGKCPDSHPVAVPELSMNVRYPTIGGPGVTLGLSDEDVGAHADFFNAWDQVTLERLVRMCLNTGIECDAGRDSS